jgi:hypothetical protein
MKVNVMRFRLIADESIRLIRADCVAGENRRKTNFEALLQVIKVGEKNHFWSSFAAIASHVVQVSKKNKTN